MTTSSIAPVVQERTVNAPAETCFRVFVDGFASWWPPEHHIGEGRTIEHLTLEPRVRFGSLQVVFDGRRSVLVATSNGGAVQTYNTMLDAYRRILERVGLKNRYWMAQADTGMCICVRDFSLTSAQNTGTIGGDHSHEFQVLSTVGEDELLKCDQCECVKVWSSVFSGRV